MSSPIFLAVDLGASSGRVLAGAVSAGAVRVADVHRFANEPVLFDDCLHWDVLRLWHEVVVGLRKAAQRFGSRVRSVGVDTWGVDFGLLDRGGRLLASPLHYRRRLGDEVAQHVFRVADRAEIFRQTGLQFLPFNTLFQLAAMKLDQAAPLEQAHSMLMMPDLFHWLLSGNISHECSIASTTQLFNPTTRQWAWPLIDALDLPRRLFGPITEPARRLGPLRASVRDATGLADVDVVLPAAHDTASAVAAVPAMPDVSRGATWCYISSGTWSLMGVELAEPMITDEVARRNFTNEVGLGGTIRLLKNIAGLWLVQQCRAAWAREGNRLNWGDLAKAAAEAPAWQSIFDPDDPALIAPHHMPDAIADCCRRVGERAPRGVGPTIRAALESLALRYRVVLESLEQLTGQSITTIHVVGGGSRHELLCQMTADACQRVLVAGPSEATALGNIVAQAIAAGVVPSVQDARRWLAKRCRLREFRPQPNEGWDRALARFRAVT